MFALAAVFIIPEPKGFVNMIFWFILAALFLHIKFGSTMPQTLSPYLGSSSFIECPPTNTAPDSITLSCPPLSIWFRILVSRQEGKPTIFNAKIGVPPIAYTSASALAAAICPKISGSSTTGVNKSNVCIIAVSSLIL